MSLPGWYPDPGGRPGHYRFWDGQAWAPTTTAELPGAPAGPPRRRVAPWVVVVALVVVLGVVAALVTHEMGRPVAGPTAAPSYGGSYGPPPGITPGTVPPSTPDVEDPPSEVPSAACPAGDPFARQDHPQDDRVHGGGLSIPRQPGWEDPGPQASAFSWAYDLGETDLQLAQTRYAAYAVGAVSVADGFEDPRSAAELAMRCTVASALYSNVSSRTDLVDERTTLDGHRAWTIRSEIRAYDSRTRYEGDTVQITVVDLDSPEALAFFWGSAPLGDATFTHQLDGVVDDLQVD